MCHEVLQKLYTVSDTDFLCYFKVYNLTQLISRFACLNLREYKRSK